MEDKRLLEQKKYIERLNNFGESFETMLNLANIHLVKGENSKAYYYYVKSLDLCEDEDIKNKIRINIDGLYNEDTQKYIERKKILIIAHIFPPIAGSGVQRTLKFVKKLRKFNYEPIIITVGKMEASYFMDETLTNEIPEGVEVVRIDEPSGGNSYDVNYLIKLYKDMVNETSLTNQYVNLLLKDNNSNNYNYYSLPDTLSFWGISTIKQINSLIDFDNIDAIYSTSGPYTNHMIAYQLKKSYKKKWIADFRDEWTNNPYFEYNDKDLFSQMTRRMEKSIIEECDKMIIISEHSRQNYIDLFNVPENKIISITNGYDEEDFKNIEIDKIKNNKFTIVHNGLLYLIRTPETFLKAVVNLIKTRKIDKEKISIIFSYTENKEQWIKYLKNNKLEKILEFKDYMSHKDSINMSINSDLLLLIVGAGENNKSVYTGKVFEYLRMRRPILALAPKESLVEELMKETESGASIEFYDVKKIENYILEMYNNWLNQSEKAFINNINIEKYERQNLTLKLANIFDEII